MSVVESDLLFKLPVGLVGDILGSWVSLKDIVNLDSSYCNHQLRASWRQLLQAEEVAYDNKKFAPNGDAWNWLSSKDLKVSCVKFTSASEGWWATATYLKKYGNHVREIRVNGGLAMDMRAISRHCTQLRYFECQDTVVDNSFRHILECNPTLEVLYFIGLSGLKMDNLSLPHVHSIAFHTCPGLNDATALAVTRLSNKVTTLGLDFCGKVSKPTLVKMITSFPRLQSLALGGLHLDNTVLGKITQLCPFITNLMLYGNKKVTDSGMETLLEDLTRLKYLDIQACTSLTDKTLHSIGQYSVHLEALSIGDEMTFSPAAVGAVATQCTNLRTLIWTALPSAVFLQCDLEFAFSGLSNLKTLLLGDGMCTDAVLCLVATHCTQLRNLNLYYDAPNEDEDEEYDLPYTGKGVFAVAQGCPALRNLTCKDDDVVNELAQQFWKQLRPQLVFSQDDDLFCSNVLREPL